MPELTPKREKFAQAFVETGIGAEAYRRAFSVRPGTKPTSIVVSASKLLADPNVALRVAQLQAEARKRHALTVDDLVAELDENRGVALKALVPQSAAATAATLGKAKLLGFLKDKIEIEATILGMAERMRQRKGS
ncbi:terminase small subunit [Variovorax sp. GT1P44]|uniref:terminase small subunit n=1 Tax=Variovorax sp. GT1P44 TaxID=3443742 RepID=UPI003F44D522